MYDAIRTPADLTAIATAIVELVPGNAAVASLAKTILTSVAAGRSMPEIAADVAVFRATHRGATSSGIPDRGHQTAATGPTAEDRAAFGAMFRGMRSPFGQL